MTVYNMQLQPRDLLFMRDARPMEASDAGLGANWPRPDQLWNALLNAFHRKWPERQPWEGEEHTRGLERDRKHANSSFRFGALRSAGPFPMDTVRGECFFPCPMDLSSDENGMLLPMKLVSGAGSNLVAPLEKMLQAQALGKTANPGWLPYDEYLKYLNGRSFMPAAKEELYDAERNIGIAIDSDSGTTVNGRLYQAEYLRLRPGVSLAFKASCMLTPKGQEGQVDLFDKMKEREELIIGGQQSVAIMTKVPGHATITLPAIKKPAWKEGMLLRWTLLAPMIAKGGWLPGWIDGADGKVMLACKESTARNPRESRKLWRRRMMHDNIKAKLLAACIGKPLAFSGWDLQDGGPKPTVLAVPAGSAFYFRCEDAKAFSELWAALSFNEEGWQGLHSEQFGEKGFGLGVCSVVNE